MVVVDGVSRRRRLNGKKMNFSFGYDWIGILRGGGLGKLFLFWVEKDLGILFFKM